MINGFGVLGWGVGGIEAEAAMLGQPVSMLIPLVVGVKLTGRLREGATATDLFLRLPRCCAGMASWENLSNISALACVIFRWRIARRLPNVSGVRSDVRNFPCR